MFKLIKWLIILSLLFGGIGATFFWLNMTEVEKKDFKSDLLHSINTEDFSVFSDSVVEKAKRQLDMNSKKIKNKAKQKIKEWGNELLKEDE